MFIYEKKKIRVRRKQSNKKGKTDQVRIFFSLSFSLSLSLSLFHSLFVPLSISFRQIAFHTDTSNKTHVEFIASKQIYPKFKHTQIENCLCPIWRIISDSMPQVICWRINLIKTLPENTLRIYSYAQKWVTNKWWIL